MSWVNLILFHIDLPLSLCTNILRPHQGQKEQDLEWVQTISKKVCIITKYLSYDLPYKKSNADIAPMHSIDKIVSIFIL